MMYVEKIFELPIGILTLWL